MFMCYVDLQEHNIYILAQMKNKMEIKPSLCNRRKVNSQVIVGTCNALVKYCILSNWYSKLPPQFSNRRKCWIIFRTGKNTWS